MKVKLKHKNSTSFRKDATEFEQEFQDFDLEGTIMPSTPKTKVKKSQSFVEEEEEESREASHKEYRNGWGSSNNSHSHAYRVKEVDLSEVPVHMLSNLIEANPSQVGALTLNSIDEEAEGWIIQCPRNVDLKNILCDKKIHLNGIPSILAPNEEDFALVNGESDGVTYEAVAIPKEDTEENMFLILPDGEHRFKMASLPLNGFISIRKHVEEIEPPEVDIPRKKQRTLPEGIKERHPIYGVDFSAPNTKVTRRRSPTKKMKKLDYEEDVTDFVQKLSFSKSKRNSSLHPTQPSPTLSTPEKSSKKSKKILPLLDTFNNWQVELESTSQVIDSPRKSKKAKKTRKVVEEVEPEPETLPDVSNYCPDELDRPTKHKKTKKRKRDAETDDSQSDSSTLTKLKKKVKREPAEEYIPSPEELAKKLKRMKRSKSRDKEYC